MSCVSNDESKCQFQYLSLFLKEGIFIGGGGGGGDYWSKTDVEVFLAEEKFSIPHFPPPGKALMV